MTRTVIWRLRCDGQQHLATLKGNPDDGYRLQTACGLTRNSVRFDEFPPAGEVTCPACRTEETLAALAKCLAA